MPSNKNKETELNCEQQQGYLRKWLKKEEGVCVFEKNVYVTGSQRVWHHRPCDQEVMGKPEWGRREMKIPLNCYWVSLTQKANRSFSPSPRQKLTVLF